MKSFLTLPKDSDFFNRYARLIPALKVSGYLAQVVSALTELGVLFTAIHSSLVFFVPKLATGGALIGALIGVAIIETGLRVLLPFSIRAILHRRFAGLDLPLTIIVWAACAVLLSAGTLMSFHGSRDIVEKVKPKPKQENSTKAERVYSHAQKNAVGAYRADSTEIDQRYSVQIEAIKAQYAAQLSQANGQIKGIEAKERRGQSFATAKGNARERVATLEAERATKLATLEADKGKELGTAADRKTTAIEKASNDLEQARLKVSVANDKTAQLNEATTNRYKGGLSWFTIICHLILIVSVAVDEIHKKGSGIEAKVVPTQYDFSGSILGELFHALGCRWNQFIRERIRRIEESTPPPPLPLSPNELYSLDNMQQPVFNVNFEQLPDAYKNITVPHRAPGGSVPTPAPPPNQPGTNTGTPPPTQNGTPGNGSTRRKNGQQTPGGLNGYSLNGSGTGKH
ncbi:hypothetical protein [Haliscomenobacter sp.]|uniref:hypothetical protein n=1 Tax=Haliscomenobacter sp. TaxID=2717303 RepID=UPI003BAC6E65